MKNPVLFLTLLVFLIACQSNSNNSSSIDSTTSASIGRQIIDAPLPRIESTPYKFSFAVDEAQELTTPTGSKIIVPANTFVDIDGNALKGEVDIEFEEFHSASDIILSGIPMNITTEDGEMGAFESAGMFKINGSQNGKEIRIGNNKTLEVQMASFKEGEDFDFFEYDEEAGNWALEGRTAPILNDDKIEAERLLPLEPIQPIEIKRASSSDLVFDLEVDKKSNPEFAHFDNVLWRMADGSEEKQLFSEEIRNPHLECIDANKSVFRLTGNLSSRKVKARVTPVLFGSNWKKAKASFDKKMVSYKKDVKVREDKLKSIDKMANMRRVFGINNFGIYNFDRIYHLKRKVQFNALFFLPAIKKAVKKAYLIMGRDKVAIPYAQGSGYIFSFDPKERNTVITFDDQGNLYEFSYNDFAKTDFEGLDKDTDFTFQMKETDVQILNEDDLEQYLAAL